MGQEGNLSTEKFDPSAFRMRALVYGGPGVGKTRFLITAPKPYVIDSDRGLLSVVGEDVGYFQPETWPELISKMAEIVQWSQSGKWDRQTLCFDSFSTLYDLIMSDVLRHEAPRSGVALTPVASRRELAEQTDYGLAHNRLTQLLMTAKRLPVHLIVVCHEQIDTVDRFGAKKEVGTLELPGKLPYKLPAMFDTVFRMTITEGQDKKGQRTRVALLQTAPEGNYMAKHRAPPGRELPLYVEPDFTKILNHLLGIAPKEGA